MPNLCYNSIRIVGSEELIQEILDTKFSFQHFFPQPDQESRLNIWGTTVDLYDYEVKNSSLRDISLFFITSWSPPIPFYQKFLDEYPGTWMRANFEILNSKTGVWIGENVNGELEEKFIDWQEPA